MKAYKFNSACLLLSCIATINTHAACFKASSKSNTYNFGTIIVQRDAAIGTKLGTVEWASLSSAAERVLTCYGGGLSKYFIATGTPDTQSHVYSTNIQGVGFKIMDSGGNYFENPAGGVNWGASNVGVNWGRRYTVELVKTGPIISGAIASGLIAKAWGDGDSSSDPYLSLFMGNAVIKQVACSITTPSLIFPLGNVLASTFGTTVGTTPSAAQNTQNLGLNCEAGANINVTFSGTQNPDVATTSVLALTGQGNSDVANGVGVQILYNNAPLVLEQRIVLKQSTGGMESFPLTARYYQTKSTVTTGKANASATLNLTYQ